MPPEERSPPQNPLPSDPRFAGRDECRTSYDRVAEEYAKRIFGELEHKPFDRDVLDRLAALVGDTGTICDVGCGPGQVARHLHGRGARVCGADLSPEMVALASRLNPGIDFRVADMARLDVSDSSWAAIAAFYSIIHIPRAEVPAVLAEFRRVLRPGGWLQLAFHIGDQTLHLDDWWDRPVCVDFQFFRTAEMTGWLMAAGFEVEEALERDPYPEVEHQSRRAYIRARTPMERR